MYLKQKILRSSFWSFFDDFWYAGATIVALCSQGLSLNKGILKMIFFILRTCLQLVWRKFFCTEPYIFRGPQLKRNFERV